MEGNEEAPDVIDVELSLGVILDVIVHMEHVSGIAPVLVLTEKNLKAVSTHNPCVEQLFVVFDHSSIFFLECLANIVPGAIRLQKIYANSENYLLSNMYQR